MVQTILAILIGLAAFLYVGTKFLRQFKKIETDPKCDNCPIPELKSSIKARDRNYD